MPRHPTDRRPPPTPERMQKTNELFESLCTTCRPFVEAIIRKQCTDELSNASLTTEEADEMLATLRVHLIDSGASPEEADEALKEVEQRVRDPKTVTPEEIDQVVDQATTEETGLLVSNWINILAAARMLPSSGNTIIDLYGLDDAMLPQLSGMHKQLYEMLCSMGMLGEDDVRTVLRQVKAGLPAGAALPADLVKLFENEGTFVIQ